MPSACISRLLLSLAAACLAATIFSGAARANATHTGIALAGCVARVMPGDTPARMMNARSRYDCMTGQHRHGTGDYWVLSAVPGGASAHHMRVRVPSLWQEGLTLHARYADGKVATIRETSATLSHRIQLGAIVEIALPERGIPLTRLLWRVDGSANARGILFDQHLATPLESNRANMRMAAMYAAFAGLALGLLIYNFALWSALRHGFQLAYCAMVTCLLGYALSSSGALAWLVPALDNNDRIRINYILLGLVASMVMVFARTFFEARIFSRWLSVLTGAAIALLAASGVTYAIFSHVSAATTDYVCSWIFIAGLAVILPILWQAWRRGSHYLWFFAAAWSVPAVFAVARILAGLHLLPTTFWIDNSTVLSLAAEALLSSVAIAYRVRMLSRERDEALAGETIARQLADADPLTGLLNRRAFLGQAIGREGRQTLHVIDIDHFKLVNETLGHDGGDEVLRLFARTLRGLMPDGALLSRIGGEEFAIVTSEGKGLDPERILGKLRATRMPFDLSVTACIGSCSGPLLTEVDWKKLYHEADRALFEAKSAGRDRARLAPPRAFAA